MNRKQALAKHLEVKASEIKDGYDKQTFEVGRQEYMVLSDAEANRKAREYILDSLWAFRSYFIHSHMSAKMQDAIDPESIEKYCSDRCEDANAWVSALIKNKKEFVEDAIEADGRGHFLSTYDGEEHEVDQWFVYRTN